MLRRGLQWCLGTSVLTLVFATFPVSPSGAAEIVPTKFVAPNGLTVVVLEQHFLPIVEVHALVKSGSAQDPPEKAGLANLVASLLDEGTTSRTSKQLYDRLRPSTEKRCGAGIHLAGRYFTTPGISQA
jgi:zinc protease